MDWVQYAWTPLVAVAGVLWRILWGIQKTVSAHDAQIAVMEETCSTLKSSNDDARLARKEIFTTIADARKENETQHATLRKEQRQDFKEIRDAIAAIGK